MAGEPPYRYARILLAEVVAVTAPARRIELEAWRRETGETVERNKLAAAKREAESAIATTNLSGDSPPQPPPEPDIAMPLLPMSSDVLTAVELFELEVLQGKEQGQTFVSAGGPCGNSPSVGHQYLVFIEYSGIAHFMQDRQPSLRQSVDEHFLQQVRSCVQGQCPDPWQTDP